MCEFPPCFFFCGNNTQAQRPRLIVPTPLSVETVENIVESLARFSHVFNDTITPQELLPSLLDTTRKITGMAESREFHQVPQFTAVLAWYMTKKKKKDGEKHDKKTRSSLGLADDVLSSSPVAVAG